ncbi:peptide-methionine (S)-S-oxide reductase MsrA [Pseudotabrizicola algicola]|uniref:Peptide methionine sulfoxide reductase MsrA n=1 Tax=Pseudotabrizicola algicola TaxID=2709381 RepID=A0A6B3RRZ5_9RHOB|nr:peptide-methionine (S)-S-oxide reductase MsrA [Pseudotabrizicola algicola]NEX48083.1 peptide-methionine (S)-S-oxide reductase MsrA [Pseudotabrizicola algicola]
MHRMMSILTAIVLLGLLATTGAHAATERAIVAGGCFWCVEADFEKVEGVRSVVSGYTGGSLQNPTYKNHDGHYEAVEITFDTSKISYAQIIAMFLRSVDVTDAGGQFCDRGASYRTAIFVSNAAQKAAAEAAVAEAGRALGQKIVTPVLPASIFWKAEAYHQDYYKSSEIVITRSGPKQKKNAYTFYRQACGRDARVKQLWGRQAAFAK